MGSPCNMSIAGDYAPKHVPFLDYENVQNDSARCAAHVVDYSHFAADLAAPATYSLISRLEFGARHARSDHRWRDQPGQRRGLALDQRPPDLGLPGLYAGWAPDHRLGRGRSVRTLAPDDPIPFILISPFAKNGGYVSTVHADHRALLATIEDGLGLPRLGAASIAPLADYFPPN